MKRANKFVRLTVQEAEELHAYIKRLIHRTNWTNEDDYKMRSLVARLESKNDPAR